MTDASIEENIAFGIPKQSINHERVKEVVIRAQLAEVIDRLPNGLATIVGERGVRLSGGQRQRIGIARALYKKASVIIFDEATSALDSKTEKSIISSINQLGPEITVLMIAHRLTTLSGCNRVIELEGGRIVRQGSYKRIVGLG